MTIPVLYGLLPDQRQAFQREYVLYTQDQHGPRVLFHTSQYDTMIDWRKQNGYRESYRSPEEARASNQPTMEYIDDTTDLGEYA